MMRAVAAGVVGSFTAIALTGCGGGGSPSGPEVGEQCAAVFEGTPVSNSAIVPTAAAYDAAVQSLDMEAVKADMTALLADSKDCWPADYGNYGPFMVRLAWHCAGTYRNSDGVGGCAGGRQRFEPERSWPDNSNLDKARALLHPLKEKYGDALSWGDLFILAGTTALRDAGAPLSKMCFGRLDETDGAASNILNEPCEIQGQCEEPWGPTTVGLIYVNPEGPLGEPNPDGSVQDIRRTFTTMGHDDRSTVALIGGGHTIGKAHGACPQGGGLSPKDAFEQNEPIYKGACGTGKGADTFTSGFEGAWTSNPLQWDNEFFTDTQDSTWELFDGPGGHKQWRIQGSQGEKLRLTSDIALLHDANYSAIVHEFANDMAAFNQAFDKAWFDLTTTNVGGAWSPNAKCDDGSTPTMRKSQAAMRGDDPFVPVYQPVSV